MPHRIAIVGAGPAGFYTAQALHKLRDFPVQVDLFDRLPTPFGLVRSGVAPDHPGIKAVSRSFTRTVARAPHLRFFGNLRVGRDLSVGLLEDHYDAVVWAVGCEGGRTLGLPGEDLSGVWTAADLVAWYNGHPDLADAELDLSAVRRVVVVGNGNVALDVARILASPVDRLANTDIADRALRQLRHSSVEEVVVVGRRGLAQAAFTAPELRELLTLERVAVRVEGDDGRRPEEPGPAQQRLFTLLDQHDGSPKNETSRTVVLRFCSAAVGLEGHSGLEAVQLADTRLEAQGGRVVARPTGTTHRLAAELMVQAVGYEGVGLPGLPARSADGSLPNVQGRLCGPDGGPRPGHYVVGWARRGPRGVLGTNRPDAREVVGLLWEDLHQTQPKGAPDLADQLPATRVDWSGWEHIDAEETTAGASLGRPRVKLETWQALLAAAEP